MDTASRAMVALAFDLDALVSQPVPPMMDDDGRRWRMIDDGWCFQLSEFKKKC